MSLSSQELIPLREGEMSTLIRASTAGREVRCKFGTGGAALIVAESAWAIPILERMRGIPPEDFEL